MKWIAVSCMLAVAATGQRQEDPPFRLPDGVELKADLVYAKYGERELRLDLFLPENRTGRIPAVVYVHGGGWRGGNKGQFQRQAAHMAARGFAGACIEYRLSGEAKWPAAIHDTKAAVRWIRANAAKYGIDPERIGAAGGSAGGHLAALLGTSHRLKELEGDGGSGGVSSRVSAVAAFNPAVDLVSFGKGPPSNGLSAVTEFIGKPYAEAAAVWAKATPLTHVSRESARFLFLHGTGDTTAPYQQSVDMLKKLKAAGVHAEIFTAEGAAHGFFNRPPWFEPTLKRMEEFFVQALR